MYPKKDLDIIVVWDRMAVSRNWIKHIYVEDKLGSRFALDMDIRAVLCFVTVAFHHQQRAAAHP